MLINFPIVFWIHPRIKKDNSKQSNKYKVKYKVVMQFIKEKGLLKWVEWYCRRWRGIYHGNI